MLADLAGVVHDRQSPDYEHRHGEDDQYGGFHCDLATAGPNTYQPRFFVVQNEPTVNAQDGVCAQVSIGNSAQYQYGNKHDGERYANRFSNRTLVAHDSLISTFKTI